MTATQEADRALVADAFERWDDLTPEAKKAALQIADRLTGASLLPKPQPGPQTAFLESEADIVVYGGAAGGGKTFGLLLDFAKPEYISNPAYGFVIFRRTSPEITNEGGLWDESQELYRQLGAHPRLGDHSWKFPSGAGGRFAHLVNEDDKYRWQGAQVGRIGFDELTHFSETQFFYLVSRNRSMSGIASQIRATCNPHPGWVKKFLSPWLDKKHLDPAASGEVRWFARIDGNVIWVDKDWRDEEGDPPKSVTFIRSTVYDNKILLEKDRGYLTNLKSLPVVEQARLLRGDWDVFEGSFFDEWSDALHTEVPTYRPPTETTSPLPDIPKWWTFFGGMDWGYSASSAFGFTLNAQDERGVVRIIETMKLSKNTNPELAAKVCGLLAKWGVPFSIPIACDPSMWSPTRNAATGRYDGPKDIEAFWRAGLSGCAPADNNRQAGWSHMRSFLHAVDTDGKGMLRCWRGYTEDLIEQFPLQQYSKKPGVGQENDMDTTGDDHLHDAERYALMTRPRPAVDPYAPKPVQEYDWTPGASNHTKEPVRRL